LRFGATLCGLIKPIIPGSITPIRDKDAALCPRARVLADIYGAMIYHRTETVLANTLSPAQNESLSLALNQQSLGL